MTTAFQSDAFQNNAFQIDAVSGGSDCPAAFQGTAFNPDAFQTCSGGTTTVTPSILPAGGNYLEWWNREWDRIREERRKRKQQKVPKKKRELLDELDEALVELKSRIQDTEDQVPVEVQSGIGKIQSFSMEAVHASITEQQVKAYLSFAEYLLREIDEEESLILLALH